MVLTSFSVIFEKTSFLVDSFSTYCEQLYTFFYQLMLLAMWAASQIPLKFSHLAVKPVASDVSAAPLAIGSCYSGNPIL